MFIRSQVCTTKYTSEFEITSYIRKCLLIINMALHITLYVYVSLFILLQISCSADTSCNCPYPTYCDGGRCMCRDGFNTTTCTQSTDMCHCSSGEECMYGNCTCAQDVQFSCMMLPLCDSNINISCKHNATCVIKENQPYCLCPSNITDCTPNRCDEQPCPIGECIPRKNNDYNCKCPNGGVGKDCKLNIHCTEGFCTNGGTCFEFQYAKCRCMEGYDGPRCENNHMLSECDQFATRNITTNPISNETECICKPNFKGKTCSLLDCTKQNECVYGLCYSDPSTPQKSKCVCPSGMTGTYCNDDIDECQDTPCSNNGTCENILGSFVCHCPDNSTRKSCDKTLSDCLIPDKCLEVAQDGTCDANCNDLACKFDGGDCILSKDPWDSCKEEKGYCRSLSGNGRCDRTCNNEDCLYDLSDCNKIDNTTCSVNCTEAWGDGQCQPQCNSRVCGYDGSDCIRTGTSSIGTIVVNYFSRSAEGYRSVGRLLSSHSGAYFTFKSQTTPMLMINKEQQKPMSTTSRESKYTAFYDVSNSVNCTTTVGCWNDTESLSRFSAVIYMRNGLLFHHNMMPLTIQNIRACLVGYYGENCDHPCPTHCNNTLECNIATGTCLTGCVEGFWGERCTNQCNEHCEKGGCNGIDGNCTDGACNIGYEGAQCDQKCSVGTYGMNCIQNCSVNCDTDTCDNENGSCTCMAGYKGEDCATGCESGKYGRNCMLDCGMCLNKEACDGVNGKCQSGCEAGYSGEMCNHCEQGKYGKDCKLSCSNCEKELCNPDTGACTHGCTPAYTGKDCKKVLKSGQKQENANSSTIIAVIIVLVILIVVGLAVACILWRRNQEGSYVMDEKLSDQKNISALELQAVHADTEEEPLVAVTPIDKTFPDAKLVIESEGGNQEEDDKQQSDTTRSSKASDFRPESIHGNGPGGVYVGTAENGGIQVEANNSSEIQECKTNEDSPEKDGQQSEPIGVQETSKEDKEQSVQQSADSVSANDNQLPLDDQNENTSKASEKAQESNEGNETVEKPDMNQAEPVTTVDNNGVVNTNQL
ncbi:Hypothetical predicted protein [Mytilus galloprovincialis]|uniref:Uncharacterized protein n=1 Tax=Mytilus galloprovincialis TaxID=29158 RepID=A0A8B6H9P0_MYTGA|nr:Hypothetical predicted protein [Mytilus galloprovincialis]